MQTLFLIYFRNRCKIEEELEEFFKLFLNFSLRELNIMKIKTFKAMNEFDIKR